MRDLEVAANGFVFSATTEGDTDGELVLFLHGFPQNRGAWRAWLGQVARSGRLAVAFDQRGYSKGARPDDVASYGMAELVSDVVELAGSFSSRPFHLVGHDWGGAVAWQVASRHGERMASLTVLGTPHPVPFSAGLRDDPDQQQRSAYMAWLRSEGAEEALLADSGRRLQRFMTEFGLPAELAEAYVAFLSDPATLTAALNWYRAVDFSLLEGLDLITAPTLYFSGTEDGAFTLSAAEASANYVSGPYRHEVLEGATHWMPELNRDQIEPLLLEHLARAGA